MSNRKMKFFIGLFSCLVLFSFESSSQVQATSELNESMSSDETLNNQEQNNGLTRGIGLAGAGLEKIPYGAKKLDGFFGGANVVGSGSPQNAIIEYYPTDGTNDNRPYDEIRLSGQRNWASIFSNDEHRVDFSKEFAGRIFINFDKANTDGLAFVLHNDTRKTGAITRATSNEDGQNLGVYGANRSVRDNIFQAYRNPVEKAIQNSVAVEFDMYNNKALAANIFDYDLGLKDNDQSHMAFTFPGNSTSYVPFVNGLTEWGGILAPEYAKLKHYIYGGETSQGSQSLSAIISDTWYEFYFKYEVGIGLYYYLYNPVTDTQTWQVLIPETALRTNLKLDTNDNKAYWGFTSANGSKQGTSRFIFSETPVDKIVSISNEVFDNKHNEITVARDAELSSKYVISGDELIIETTISLEQSDRDFTISSLQGKFDPALINLSNGTNFKVTLSLGEGAETEAIATADNSGVITLNNLNQTIPKEGGNLVVKVSLPTLSGLETTKSSFYSSAIGHYGTETDTETIESESNYFWIKEGNSPPMIDLLNLSKTSYTDFIDTLQFNWSYHDDNAVSDELKMRIELNGHLFEEEILATPKGVDISWSQVAKIDLLAVENLLVRGENHLKVTVTDAYNETAINEVRFQVVGYQGFENISTDYQWEYSLTQLPSERAPQNRIQSMTVKARDTVRESSSSKIRIQATAITSDDNSLSENQFVFKQNNIIENLSSVALDMNQEYQFSTSEGLLLSLCDQDKPGEYRGTITWTIQDAP
ncbi:hypothetical protein ACYSNU_00420 [Enterococcus sp. LJL120]